MFIQNHDHLGTVTLADRAAFNWVGQLMLATKRLADQRRKSFSYRCHSISRAMQATAVRSGNLHGFTVVDGTLRTFPAEKRYKRVAHTWLGLPSGSIVDPYPPVLAVGPILVPKPTDATSIGETVQSLYFPDDLITGQSDYLVSPELAAEVEVLVELFTAALETPAETAT